MVEPRNIVAEGTMECNEQSSDNEEINVSKYLSLHHVLVLVATLQQTKTART